MSLLLAILTGTGLSAAAGVRLFIPLLAASYFARIGALVLKEQYSWLSSEFAFNVFLAATVIEIIIYMVPGIDNVLGIISVPLAMALGAFMAVAVLPPDIALVLKWSLPVIFGVAPALATEVATNLTHGATTIGTGGLATPLVSIAETVLAVLLAVAAILLPVVIIVLLLSFRGASGRVRAVFGRSAA